MKSIVVLILTSAFMLFAAGKFQYAEVKVSSPDDIKFLQANKIDIDRTSFGKHGKPIDGKVTVYVTEDQFKFIESQGYSMKWTPLEIRDKAAYRTNTAIGDSMLIWQNRYPAICKRIQIGTSAGNRPLWVLKISDNVNVEEAEPEVKFISTMHGDEVTGMEMEMFMIENILRGYQASNDTMQFIVNNTELYVMPLMNPDGNANTSRYNGNGVDLNRNFPEGTLYEPNTPAGEEPEIAAMINWSNLHNFVLSTNYHGGAVVANYEYDADFGIPSGSYATCPDDAHVKWLAYNYSQRNLPMFNSMDFTDGITNGNEWYIVEGGMQDWNYRYYNDLDITLEISSKWPSFSEIPGFWADNRSSMFWMLSAVHKGIYGVVTDASTGLPLDAKIQIDGINKDYYTDPGLGDYYRILKPGTYSMTVSKTGYISQTINNIVVTDTAGSFRTATLKNVQLVPEGDIGGTFAMNQTSLSYGNVDTGSSSVKTFLITNSHSTEILNGTITTPTGYSVAEALKEIYKENKNVLGYTIAPSSSKTFNVTFEPAASQTYSGNVVVTSTDTGHATQNIAVTGTGIAPEIDLSVGSLSASAAPNTTAMKNFNILNTGLGTLNYSISTNYTSGKDVKASGGPDAYGYKWKDSDETGGPAYSWVEISSLGTAVTLADDGVSGTIGMGMTFNFYGTDYTSLIIGDNGGVIFTGTSLTATNAAIPGTAAPNALLAAFWDDLNCASTSSGDVYYYYDSANSRFIIEYNAIVDYGTTNTNTFEIILYESGKIVYQYKTLNGILNECTVGIENATGSVGSQVIFNAAYLKNNLAIQFQATPEWLTLNDTSGTILATGNKSITATCSAADLGYGTYTADVTITSNDIDEPTKVIPVTFIVSDVVVPGVPSNVVTSVVGTNLVVDWNVSADATSYDVFSSDSPYGTFAFEANVTTNQYTVAYTASKKFYYIVAKNATK